MLWIFLELSPNTYPFKSLTFSNSSILFSFTLPPYNIGSINEYFFYYIFCYLNALTYLFYSRNFPTTYCPNWFINYYHFFSFIIWNFITYMRKLIFQCSFSESVFFCSMVSPTKYIGFI